MKLTPRPEQEVGIERTIQEFTEGTMAALWGSEMDTGKTLQAAEVVVRMGLQRVLYVGVKDTYGQWAERLADQSDGAISLRRLDSTKKGTAAFDDFLAGKPGHYFVGSQMLSTRDWDRVPDLGNDGRKYHQIDKKTEMPVIKPYRGVIGPSAGPVWVTKRRHLNVYKKMAPVDLVIFDEVHAVGNKKSNGIGTTRSIPTKRKLGMSGTWYGNKFLNAHTICRWLWPSATGPSGDLLIDPATTRWVPQWCMTETPTRKGGLPVTDPRGNPVKIVMGEKEPGEFVKILPCYIRLDSPAGEVPKPELIYVDLTPAQRRDYDQMVEDSMMWLNAHPGLEPLVASLPISKRARLRTATLGTMSLRDGEVFFDMETESSKMAALRRLLDRPDWSGRPVAIYTESKRFAKVLVARMRRGGFNAVEWSGDVSSVQRDEIKRKFLAGEVQYIVAVISAFGTGLDGFQRVCNRVAWVSESDNNKDNEQAIRRFFRTGGDLEDFKHAKILANDTIDVGVLVNNEAKSTAAQLTMKIAS